MADKDQRKVNANDDDQRSNRENQRPDRGEPDPGGRAKGKAGQDATDKSTRSGER